MGSKNNNFGNRSLKLFNLTQTATFKKPQETYFKNSHTQELDHPRKFLTHGTPVSHIEDNYRLSSHEKCQYKLRSSQSQEEDIPATEEFNISVKE